MGREERNLSGSICIYGRKTLGRVLSLGRIDLGSLAILLLRGTSHPREPSDKGTRDGTDLYLTREILCTCRVETGIPYVRPFPWSLSKRLLGVIFVGADHIHGRVTKMIINGILAVEW